MTSLRRLVVLLLGVVFSLPAMAQSEWTYSLSPIVWGAGLKGAIQLGNDFDKIRATFNDGFGAAEVGGSLGFEMNDGTLGIIIEGRILDVSGGAEPPNTFVETADTEVDHQFWMAAISWRLRDAAPVVDVVFGARYIDAVADIRILEDGVVVRQRRDGEDWIDGILGARVRHDIGNKWRVVAYLDFGAGDSDLSYRFTLGGEYRFAKKVSAAFGYDLISTDYRITEAFMDIEEAQLTRFHYSSMKIAGPYVGLRFDW